MGCVTRQEYTSQPPAIRHARVERVDRPPLDLERTIFGVLHDKRANLVVAHEVFFGFTGQLHEFPAHPLSDRRQFDARTTRVAAEGDLAYVVFPDNSVDHQPVLRIGRTYEPGAKQLADSTGASVAGDHVF